MSAGVVMQRLRAMGVKSMLLTSGTLSPLAATAEELSVPMHVRIENPHVVAAEQVRLMFDLW
jgi:regulator of telomere elongation helicase 1